MGHLISQGEVRMDRRKVKVILDWPALGKVMELHSFLGLTNYCWKFIKRYYKVVIALTDLLKKNWPWGWDEDQKWAFEKLKAIISSETLLKLPDFEVHTDASDKAVVGVLVQEGHPVAFGCWKLKDAELKFSMHEKEMLAMIHYLKVWWVYILGTHLCDQDKQSRQHLLHYPEEALLEIELLARVSLGVLL